jgi:hypothetical protein
MPIRQEQQVRRDVNMLTIHGGKNGDELLVELRADGRVVIYKDGGAPEAAKVFWDSLSMRGVLVMSRLQAAHEIIAELQKHVPTAGNESAADNAWGRAEVWRRAAFVEGC